MKTPLVSNKFNKEEIQPNKILNEYLNLVYQNHFLDSEKIVLQEEKIKDLLNVLINNFLKDINTKTKTKMLESHEDIQNKIDNLEKYQEIKITIENYMKQLEKIEQAIK